MGWSRCEATCWRLRLSFYDTLAKQSGESEKVRGDRARALARLGSTYAQLGRIDQATNQFQQALAIFLNLEQEFPASSAYRRRRRWRIQASANFW